MGAHSQQCFALELVTSLGGDPLAFLGAPSVCSAVGMVQD